ALCETGNLAEAEAYFRKAIAFNLQFAPSYYGLGWALLRQGHFNQALMVTGRFQALLSPDDPQQKLAQAQYRLCVALQGKKVGPRISTSRFSGTLTATVKEAGQEVKLKAGQTCLIDLRSARFDAQLRVFEGQTRLTVFEDFTPNARIVQVVFT